MLRLSLRVHGLALLFSMTIAVQASQAQVNFTNSGQVSAGSPITGTLSDAAGDSVGYEISTVGPLFFGWNGQAASEPGGVQTNFSQSSEIVDWVFTVSFDSPIDQLTLGQTPIITSGADAGGTLAVLSDASSVSVDLGTLGLGSDGLSNLAGAFPVNGGDVIATLLPTFNDEDDWSVELNNVQSLTVLYQPIGASTADIGSEWFTFSNAVVGPPVAVIPEPSAVLGLGFMVAAFGLRRRRVG